jgi:hypothetical protein
MVLESDRYDGEITVNGITAPIGFEAYAGPDCRVVLNIDPVSSTTYTLVCAGDSRPGQTARQFALSGRSADGKTLASDSVCLDEHGSGTDGFHLQLHTQAVRFTRRLETPVEKPFLRLWLRSFRSFRNSVVTTNIGRVAVQGESRPASNDEVSGSIVVEALSSAPDEDWRDMADGLLRHMHDGLAFAHGGRLQSPMFEFVEGRSLSIVFYAGSSFASELPVQYYLQHDPFIRSLATRFDTKGPLPEMLWTALGWMQSDTTIDEIRFLTAMTAIEAIIESQLPARRRTIIAKPAFAALRHLLSQVVSSDASLDQSAREIFLAKLSGINQKTLSEKMSELFDHYGISKRNFEGSVIVDLIKTRNEIIHKGVAPPAVDLWSLIVLVRELITRILLKEIGFVGRYCCYIDGLQDRDFPEPASPVPTGSQETK